MLDFQGEFFAKLTFFLLSLKLQFLRHTIESFFLTIEHIGQIQKRFRTGYQ